MITRNKVLSKACDECIKEIYSYAYPKVSWENFIKENEVYNSKYEIWKNFNEAFTKKDENPEMWLQYQSSFRGWEDKSMTECIGPKPYEFYYIPKDIMEDICQSYINAYNIDAQQELLNTINILKDYCRNPIVDKYIDEHTDENGSWHPGYRSYDHPDNLLSQLTDLIPDSGFDKLAVAESVHNKFFEFLDMAGNFYNWNRDLNSFNMTVYLGASPNSNKNAVIKNWKKYRNQDIEINEEQMKKEYYGEDELD